VARVSAKPGGHDACRTDAAFQCMTHTLTAKRIDHAGCIANRDELAREFIVSQRTGHQAVSSIKVSPQSALVDEKAPIRMASLNRNTASITICKEPKIQHVAARARLRILDAKFVCLTSFRESAQFSRRIN